MYRKCCKNSATSLLLLSPCFDRNETQISDKPPFIKLELKAQRTMALWQLRINWAININRWTIVAYVHVVEKRAKLPSRERPLEKFKPLSGRGNFTVIQMQKRALFWNSTYYRRACLRIKRHAKRVVSVQERGVVAKRPGTRGGKKTNLNSICVPLLRACEHQRGGLSIFQQQFSLRWNFMP